MEIKRIDPYLAEWSVDGAVAIAAESGGIQLLVPDAGELLRGDIQWRRMRSPELAGRVLDMKWSPTGHSAYDECVLACVLDTGAAGVLENSSGQTEPWSLRLRDGDGNGDGDGDGGSAYSACAWSGHTLLLGTDDGHIHALDSRLQTAWTAAAPAPAPASARVVQLAGNAAETSVAAVLADNSVWTLELESRRWTRLLAASRFRVTAVQFGAARGAAPVVARTDGVFVFRDGAHTFTAVHHYAPAHLLVHDDAWALVHTDGRVSQGPARVPLPEIRGRVFAAVRHAFLPIGLLLLGPVSGDWEYPIVSWQWAKTAFFVLPGAMPPPRITEFSQQVYWATLLVTQKPPPPQTSLSAPSAEPAAATLQTSLAALFTSAWFDARRLEWYCAAPHERPHVVAAMRSQIAQLVCAQTPETELDRAVVRWYAAYLAHDAPKAEDSDLLQLQLSGDAVQDTFLVEAAQTDTVASQAGHIWKRCSLTLVPLLSLNTRRSLDHEFSAYRTAPGRSAIADALLGAGRFCVFSGTQWERPRF